MRKQTKHRLLLVLGVILCLTVFLFSWGRKPEDKPVEDPVRRELLGKMSQTDRALFLQTEEALEAYLPGIVCWGDSLTFGAGGYGVSYPSVLSGRISSEIFQAFNQAAASSGEVPLLAETPVINMGVGGENADTILGRNGAVPMVTAEAVSVPFLRDPVEIRLVSANGDGVEPLRQGMAGLEHVTIDGIRGYLQIDQESYLSQSFSYSFTRRDWGLPREIPAGTPLITDGSLLYKNYIPIVFLGTNGGYDSPEELVTQTRAIIDGQQGNPADAEGPRFLVLGMHLNTAEQQAQMEQVMEEAFGPRYINLRDYMARQGLEDAGIEPTEEDLKMMAEGMTPASLMTEDRLHFTAVGYELIGNLVYERMDSLHYFDEAKAAVRQAEELLP